MLALGFGRNCWEAGQQVVSSLHEDCNAIREHFVRHWRTWHERLLRLDRPKRDVDLYRTSMAVLRSHESKDFLGGIIASLPSRGVSIKAMRISAGITWFGRAIWSKPRERLWPGARVIDALRVLRYLEATQEADGHWAQNLWLDGRPYWGGLQMDETAFPILLLDLLAPGSAATLGDLTRWWPMVQKAAGFIVRNGPVTQQDRWEEDGGYSPFTLAVEIASLLAAADIADSVGEPVAAISCAKRPTAGTTILSDGRTPLMATLPADRG